MQLTYNHSLNSNTLDDKQIEYKHMNDAINLTKNKLQKYYTEDYKKTSIVINENIVSNDTINKVFNEFCNKFSILYFLNNRDNKLENNVSVNYNKLELQLNNIINECNEQNWDGYNGNLITLITYNNSKLILQKLSRLDNKNIIDMCDISPAADGSIVFEWREQPFKIFTLSILENHVVYIYINKSKNEKATGKFDFNKVDSFLNYIINYV